ncbi:MAG: LysR family transcriptional regulator [Gammaproteobacteria bacterium]
MKLEHSRYCWSAAHAGGVAAAANQLHLRPQTISAQVKLLEDDLATGDDLIAHGCCRCNTQVANPPPAGFTETCAKADTTGVPRVRNRFVARGIQRQCPDEGIRRGGEGYCPTPAIIP